MRKDLDFDVIDKIKINVEKHAKIEEIVNEYYAYICSETLASEIVFENNSDDKVEIDEQIAVAISIEKIL